MTPIEACVRWYGVVAVCTWALAPFVRWLCVGLRDRGVSIARPIALLVALNPTWFAASVGLAEFRPELLIAFVAVAGVVGWGGVFRSGQARMQWLRQLCVMELASLAIFVTYVWLRGFTPDIVGTEKPMDVAFLASSARTVSMPPPDPWFAGQPINYYYLGYLIHGSIGRIAGVPPEIGFNLALATIFSMTAVAAFGVSWNVARAIAHSPLAIASGLFTAFSVVLAGNLYAPIRLLEQPMETIDAWWWDSGVGIGWRSSRIVCDGPRLGNLCQFPAIETINEFPSFSFVLGDLHPHLMALPFTIMAIALGWNALRWFSQRPIVSYEALAIVAITGALVGSLYALNAWDFPTYLLVVAGGIAFGIGSARKAWKPLAVLVAASVMAWLPFTLTYSPPTVAQLTPALAQSSPLARLFGIVSLHGGERTSIGEYLTIFGVPYIIGVLLLVTTYVGKRDASREGSRWSIGLVVALALVSGILLAAPLLPLCGIPLTLAIVRLFRGADVTPRTFALALFCLAWLISIGVEFLYLRDLFDSRMNTLFKFYYQTWTLYAVAAGVALAVLWHESAGVALGRAALTSAVVAAIVLGAAYPIVSTYQWTDHFTAWRGLDGLAFGDETDPDDVAAIRWLSAQSRPGEVVLEAAGCSYRPFSRLPFSRVSAFTGVPTVIGWDGHERQWRAGQPAALGDIPRRQSAVAAMFADPESPLFADFAVTWLFVGSYEAGNWRTECDVAGPYANVDRPGYPGEGWQEAFRSGETRIYRRAAR